MEHETLDARSYGQHFFDESLLLFGYMLWHNILVDLLNCTIMPFNHNSGQYYIADDGAKIYYEETGNPDAPVLLLLHGGFGSIEDFNTIILNLSKDFRIIGIDSRGQGKSTLGQKDLSYELIADDIEQILKIIRLKKINIIGFSDGGIVAYRLSVFSDLAIDKLITIGARWHKNNVTDTKQTLVSVTAETWRSKFPETVNAYESINPEPNFNHLASAMVKMWLNEQSYPNERVKDIQADTLVIRGDKDHLTKLKFVYDIAQLIEKCNISNIALAGHAVQQDAPEILQLTINSFLEKRNH